VISNLENARCFIRRRQLVRGAVYTAGCPGLAHVHRPDVIAELNVPDAHGVSVDQIMARTPVCSQDADPSLQIGLNRPCTATRR